MTYNNIQWKIVNVIINRSIEKNVIKLNIKHLQILKKSSYYKIFVNL